MTDPRAALETHVRTQAELEAVWRSLMGELGFSRASLWFLLVGADDVPTPLVSKLDDDGAPPDAEHLRALATMLLHLVQDTSGGRVAFLRSRPGRDGLRAADRTLVAALLAACAEVGLPTDVVHVADDVDVRPVTGDELARSA